MSKKYKVILRMNKTITLSFKKVRIKISKMNKTTKTNKKINRTMI